MNLPIPVHEQLMNPKNRSSGKTIVICIHKFSLMKRLTKNFFDPLTVVSCFTSNSTTFRFLLYVKLPISFGQPDSYLHSENSFKFDK